MNAGSILAASPRIETLDLASLAPQHRPEIALGDLGGLRAFDANVFRRDFPILRETVNGRPLIWLDNGATTQKPQCVIDRLAHFYSHENSNIHRAAHELAARATDAYEGARNKVARFLGAKSSSEIIFVRGTTEGINLVAQAWCAQNLKPGDVVLATEMEHHSNLVPWQQLARATGATLRLVPVTGAEAEGGLDLTSLDRLLTPAVKVFAFTHASNTLGVVNPAAALCARARAAGYRGPFGFQGFGIKGDSKALLKETMEGWRRIVK